LLAGQAIQVERDKSEMERRKKIYESHPKAKNHFCSAAGQGCQMVYFQTKNPNFWLNLEGLGILENFVTFYNHVKYSTDIWYNLWPFGKFVDTWYIFPVLVCLDQEKSGNPAADLQNADRQNVDFKNVPIAYHCTLT
jgi:hypothetical protein